jgi:hypothetical protein
MTTVLWAVAALVAVTWPSRIIGPLDGAPLDTVAEAMVIGMVLPLAWIVHPRIFRTRVVRALVAGLAAWKLGTWVFLAQQGLCATFAVHTGMPDHLALRRSWDFRTSATAGLPRCSAVLTRDYRERSAFPAWFLNQPVGADINLDNGVRRNIELPPAPAVSMQVAGYAARAEGVEPIAREVQLAGNDWSFELPAERGALGVTTLTVTPPTTLDRVAAYLWFVTPLLIVLVAAYSVAGVIDELQLRGRWLAATLAAAAAAILLGALGDPYARGVAVVAALGAAITAGAPRLRGVPGVVIVVGVPLLAMLAALSLPQVGHFTLYSAGDDWQTFQRYAGRIYLEGFWLEGGERTFWQQPLYRWIAGLLHVVFGDSSVGEVYWDGFGLIASSVLAYVLVTLYASHEWGLTAAVTTLAITTLGPTWYLIGRGLSEISGVLWLTVAVLALARARQGHAGAAVLAGVFATLAVYTRLNHLLLVAACCVLLLPPVASEAWVRPVALLRRLRTSQAALYATVVAIGLALFAARTWYYTGQFSLLYGTTRHFNSTGLGPDTLFDGVVWRRVLDSVLMVVLVSDPPRLDPRTILVPLGVVAAVLALMRAPVLRDLPLSPAVLCIAAISSAFIARGMAYPGRFSMHLIPLAIAMCALLAVRISGRSLSVESPS